MAFFYLWFDCGVSNDLGKAIRICYEETCTFPERAMTHFIAILTWQLSGKRRAQLRKCSFKCLA